MKLSNLSKDYLKVLNLVISGIPSIRLNTELYLFGMLCFKPYYNWNTFNTQLMKIVIENIKSFKPYYNWNTFNTLDKSSSPTL